jgi:hypothetical protein
MKRQGRQGAEIAKKSIQIWEEMGWKQKSFLGGFTSDRST